MKLPETIRQEIHYFAYFLFRSCGSSRIYSASYNYYEKLRTDPGLLYSCYEVFAFAVQNIDEHPSNLVEEYICALHGDSDQSAAEIIDRVREFNKKQSNFWVDFLTLAWQFCYNAFADPVNESYLDKLENNGTDAIPVFAVWSNVVDIDEHLNVTNSHWALTRANARIKQWDGVHPQVPFKDWEIEQELY
jgi:hypothetical protein